MCLSSILILYTHVRLCLASGNFPSGFPTKILYALISSPYTCHMQRQSHYSWFDQPDNVWWGIQIMKLVITRSPLFPLTQSYTCPNIFLCTSACVRYNLSQRYTTRAKIVIIQFHKLNYYYYYHYHYYYCNIELNQNELLLLLVLLLLLLLLLLLTAKYLLTTSD
jgi:hypothetical protein